MKSIQIRKDSFFKVSRLRKHRKSRPHAGSRRTRIIDRVTLLRGTLRIQPESRLFSGFFYFFTIFQHLPRRIKNDVVGII